MGEGRFGGGSVGEQKAIQSTAYKAAISQLSDAMRAQKVSKLEHKRVKSETICENTGEEHCS